MPKKKDRSVSVVLLEKAIQEKHKCVAIHRETIHVHEKLNAETIWEGDVEVFELKGHPDADRCYAWAHHEHGASGAVINSENLRLITVLGKRPVDSPSMAVRTAIFFDVQPVPVYESKSTCADGHG